MNTSKLAAGSKKIDLGQVINKQTSKRSSRIKNRNPDSVHTIQWLGKTSHCVCVNPGYLWVCVIEFRFLKVIAAAVDGKLMESRYDVHLFMQMRLSLITYAQNCILNKTKI